MITTAVDTVNDAEKGVAEGYHLRELDPTPISYDAYPLVNRPPTAICSDKSSKSTPPLSSKPIAHTISATKTIHRVSAWVRFQLWFNTYRKFFVFIISANFVGIVLTVLGVWKYPHRYTGALILGNLQMAILMRSEIIGRFLYLVINTLFAKWTPLAFRLACTSALQHLGGIHSGCAISGAAWLLYRVISMFIDHINNHDAVLVAGIATNICVAVSILSALPWVRNTHHNVFERHHRFVGWLGMLCTWVFVILGDSYDLDAHAWNTDSIHVIRQQDFWFAFVMTVFIVIPWLTIRKVPVEIEIPSSKVVILKFERGMQQGVLSRISRGTGIMEYHAFGIISEGTHASHHYLICGVQGDFTRALVQDPPTHIWTRELKFAGVSNSSTLYKRGIRVCTGTGLGAALSTCLQNPNWYLIWIGSNQAATFGPTISALVDKVGPERRTLWDSKARGGRPDTMQLIKDVYHSWGAEVVFITSNYTGNKEMMEGCKLTGIPAFGTLWDF